MATGSEIILEKLNHIQSELAYIKGHLANMDAVLTDDDVEALHAADLDLKAGKTKRLV